MLLARLSTKLPMPPTRQTMTPDPPVYETVDSAPTGAV